MNTYNIGPLTMEYVFKRSALENVSDMQAVMDAVEIGLREAKAEGLSEGVSSGIDWAQRED